MNSKLSFVLSKLSHRDNLDSKLSHRLNSITSKVHEPSPSKPPSFLSLKNIWKSIINDPSIKISKITHGVPTPTQRVKKPPVDTKIVFEKTYSKPLEKEGVKKEESEKEEIRKETVEKRGEIRNHWKRFSGSSAQITAFTYSIFFKDFPYFFDEQPNFLKEFKLWVVYKLTETNHFDFFGYTKDIRKSEFIDACLENKPIEPKYLAIIADLMNINLVFENGDYANLYDDKRKTSIISSNSCLLINNSPQIIHSDVQSYLSSLSTPPAVSYSQKELEKMLLPEIAQIALSKGISIYKQGKNKAVAVKKSELIEAILATQ
jgi:hypothetical protein